MFLRDGPDKCIQAVIFACCLYDHSFTGIAYSAGDIELTGQIVNKGPKADALDSPTDQDFDPDVFTPCV